MSFYTFKTISFCIGQKHHSGTKNIAVEIAFNKKTAKEIKLQVGKISVCIKKNQSL